MSEEMVKVLFYGDSGPHLVDIYELKPGMSATDAFGDSLTNVIPRELLDRYTAARNRVSELEAEIENYSAPVS